ncbi:MAG: hypothetical protein ABR501_02225 [Pyrinomonadaceae bacterium]
MIRVSVIAVSILGSVLSLACQPYTSGLQQSVGKTDEISAIAAMHSIVAAQRTYSLSNGGDYGTFQQLSAGGFLDSRFNSSRPELKDYVFTMEVIQKSANDSAGGFSCNADPKRDGPQAGRHFYVDSTTPEIHVNPSQKATAQDAVLAP